MFKRAILSTLLFTFFIAGQLHAEIYNFIGTGNWNDPARWDCSCVPPNALPSSDIIVILGNCTLTDLRSIDGVFIIPGNSGGVLNISTGGQLIIQSGTMLIGSTLNMTGGTLLVKPSGLANLFSAANFNVNSGLVDVEGILGGSVGNININGGSITVSGIMGLESSCIPTVNAGGTLAVTAGGTLNVGTGIILNVNPNADLVIQTGGALNAVNASVINIGGKLTVTGQLNVDAGADLNLTNSSITFLNNNGGLNVMSGGELDHSSGSIFAMDTGGNLVVNFGGVFNSTGNFQLKTSSTLTLLNNPAVLPAGSFVWNGKVNIGNTGVLTQTSPLTVPSGAIFTIEGIVSANAQFVNNGTLNLESGGNLILNSNPASLPGGTFNWNSGGKLSVGGSGHLTLASGLTVAAGRTLEVLSGGVLQHNGGTFNLNGTMLNGGTANLNAIANINNGSSLSNTGSLNLGANINLNNGGILTNNNQLVISSGAFTINGILDNNSTLTNNANINRGSTGSFFNNGGTYQGTGLWTFDFTNPGGTISPGTSAGCLRFDGTVTLNGTTLAIELGGSTGCSQHDRLTIDNFDGTASLTTTGGTVAVSFINGFEPTSGQVFDIAVANQLFGVLPALQLPAGYTGALSFANGSLRLTITSVLPVELVNFRAFAEGEKARLAWVTASEQNNLGFSVERRSADGKHWTELGFQAGHGTTSIIQHYSFLDEKPLPTVNYYRLRQMDVDGKEAYSSIQAVDFSNLNVSENGVRTFPNPVIGGELTIFLLDHFEENTTANLYDSAGRIVRSVQLQTGNNHLGVDGLPDGLYVLQAGDFFEKVIISRL
jgi:hypothetical protein